MEGLKVSDANLVVYLHPSKSKMVTQAILRELSESLFKFSEIFDGVPLAYDVNIPDKLGKILPGIHPYFGVRLKAKLLVFSPKPNMFIEAKVVKLSEESIHAIVLGFSSAIITTDDIRQDFKFRIKHGKARYASRSQKKHVIKVGTVMRFLVKSLDVEMLHICGSLLPENTGCVNWLSNKNEDISSCERTTKKRRDMKEEIEMQDHDNIIEGASFLSNGYQVNTSKKSRIAEDQ